MIPAIMHAKGYWEIGSYHEQFWGFHPSDLTAWARVLHTIQYDFSKVPHCLKWNYSYIDVQCICTPITKNAYMKIWLVLQPGHVWKLWSASALLQPFLSHHIQLFHPDFFWGHNIFHTLLFLYTLPTQFHFQFLNQPCSLVIFVNFVTHGHWFFQNAQKTIVLSVEKYYNMHHFSVTLLHDSFDCSHMQCKITRLINIFARL